MKQAQALPAKGFTMVELLIVIAVVAILATLSYVAYGNIQQKARESRVMTQMSQIRKEMELYRIEHGRWPFNLDPACSEIREYVTSRGGDSGSGVGSVGCAGNGIDVWSYSVVVSNNGDMSDPAAVEIIIRSSTLTVERRMFN